MTIKIVGDQKCDRRTRKKNTSELERHIHFSIWAGVHCHLDMWCYVVKMWRVTWYVISIPYFIDGVAHHRWTDQDTDAKSCTKFSTKSQVCTRSMNHVDINHKKNVYTNTSFLRDSFACWFVCFFHKIHRYVWFFNFNWAHIWLWAHCLWHISNIQFLRKVWRSDNRADRSNWFGAWKRQHTNISC